MKKLWGSVGTALTWLLWPFWVVYFRIYSNRARVLIVCRDEVLLVQNWLGTRQWILPGGGAKSTETAVAAAVRELSEELGVEVPESSLSRLGSRNYKKRGIRYKSEIFCLTLAEKPALRVRRREIYATIWVSLNELHSMPLSKEVSTILRRYQPPEQASLL
jgi:8-oxo-dGTP pyrophosphatase MutT (NUDIX family)